MTTMRLAKPLSLFIALLSFCCLAKAQDTAKKMAQPAPAAKRADTIVKKSGEKIVAVLTEVTSDDISYKRYDYQDGPVFKLAKQDISTIIYGNGMRESYDTYVRPTPPQNNTDLTIQPDGWKYYYKGLLIKEDNMIGVVRKLHDKKIDLFANRTEKNKLIQYTLLLGGGLIFIDGAYLAISNRVYQHHHGSYGPPPNSTQAAAQKLGRYFMLGGIGCGFVSIYFRFARRHNAHMAMDLYNQTILSH